MRIMINSVLWIILFCVPFISRSQSNSGRLTDLYRYVEITDSLLDKSEKTFYLEKFLKDDYNYKEKWSYSLNSGKINFFQVNYLLDSTEYTEVYYLQRGNLICSEEYQTVNYSYNEDELKWGGIYYFQGSFPKHVVTLGRRDYNNRMINPETLVLTRFEKRYSELKRHLPMLP
jgi:hypothetical protein